jgi:hypothetical protein
MLAPSKGYPEPWDHRPHRLHQPYSSPRLRPLTALILALIASLWTAILLSPLAMKASETKVNAQAFFENLR